jgi:hypothetical protein
MLRPGRHASPCGRRRRCAPRMIMLGGHSAPGDRRRHPLHAVCVRRRCEFTQVVLVGADTPCRHDGRSTTGSLYILRAGRREGYAHFSSADERLHACRSDVAGYQLIGLKFTDNILLLHLLPPAGDQIFAGSTVATIKPFCCLLEGLRRISTLLAGCLLPGPRHRLAASTSVEPLAPRARRPLSLFLTLRPILLLSSPHDSHGLNRLH